MKRSKQIVIYRVKKKKKKTDSRMHLLLFLFTLVAGILFTNKLPLVITSVGVEKVFAIQEIQDASFLLSLTPTTTPSPTIAPVLSLETFAATTPSPTPPNLLETKPQDDFCLDVPILIYHHVQPLDEASALGHAQLTVDSGIFDEQIQYLVDQKYNLISSSDVVAALQTRAQLPPKSVVVTLDDGYDDFYNYAFPIAKKHNVKLDFMIPSGLIGNFGYMTWEQLKEVSQSPLISIYNHTWSHAALGDADVATIEKEVMTANSQFESTLGKKITIFVYPYGSYGPTVINFLEDHGFVGGISTVDGTIQCQSYIMTLHRTHIGNAPLSDYGF